MNMTCVMKKFRGFGYALDMCNAVLALAQADPNVLDKEWCYAEARLEMIPFWMKRFGKDRMKKVGDEYLGGNGLI